MAFNDSKINKSRSSSSLLAATATSPALPIPTKNNQQTTTTKFTDESSKKKNFLSRSSHHSYSLNKILMNANHIINGNGHAASSNHNTSGNTSSSGRKKMSQTSSWPVRFSDSSNIENDECSRTSEKPPSASARRRDRFFNKFGMRKSKASVPNAFYPNFPTTGESPPSAAAAAANFNYWPHLNRANEQNMSFTSAKIASSSSKTKSKKHLRNKSASNINDIYINIIRDLETSEFNKNMSSALTSNSTHPPLTLSSSNPSSNSSQPASPVAQAPSSVQSVITTAGQSNSHVAVNGGGDSSGSESKTLNNNNADGSGNTQHTGNGHGQANGLLTTATSTTTNNNNTSTGSITPNQVTPNSSGAISTNTSPSNGVGAGGSSSNPIVNGFLLKWTNYIKGYQKRWFVLHNGILSYFRSPTEMQHTCRGAISLENAEINFDDAQCITVSNGTNQTFHLKASSEHEKQKWVSALEAAKKLRQGGTGGGGGASHVGNANMNKPMFMLQQNESDDEDDTLETERAELEAMLHGLQEKLNELNLSQDFIQKHMNALSKSLNELNNLQGKPEDMVIKTINERSGICKIALIGMTTQCQAFIKLAQKQADKMNKISQLEREHRLRLEEMVQDMAKQQSNIELQLTKRSKEKKTVKSNTQQPVVGLVQPEPPPRHQATTQQGAEQTINSKQKLAGQALFPAPVSGSSDATDYVLATSGSSSSSQQQQQSSTSNKKANESKSVDQSSQELNKQSRLSNNQDEEEDQLNDDEFHDAVEEINFSVTLPRNQPGGAASAALMHHNRNPSSLTKLYLQESDETSDDEDHQTIKVTMHKNKEEGGGVGATSGKEVVPVQQSQHSKKPSSNDLSMLKGLVKPPVRPRRTTITPRPNYSFNLWSIMKNCIGKDLSKIPIPVNFSEPLSMLQRITEELEYSDILDKAAACDDQWEQMAYIAAFTISSYSTTATRTNKPFNPLLGETFECDRLGDYGWRSVAEQVSHHPPGAAMHVESLKGWEYYQEFTMSSKFRGQYLQIIPLGTAHLEFKKTGYHYTWRKIVTFVRNIIVGKLWIDNVGEMDIINHTTKDVCHLKYFAYSYFSRDPPRKVTGIITDSNNVARYVLNGTWTEQIEGAPVLNPQVVTQQTQLNTGKSKILWKRRYPPPHLETMYNFTELAIQLNEPEEGVAPSDSRLRPDQRLMEEAKWDEANIEKVRLEEKQRTLRKKREQEYAQKNQHLSGGGDSSASVSNANNSSSDQSMNDDTTDYNAQLQQLHANASPHDPDAAWFRKTIDPYTNQPIHVFKNDYWDCKAKHDWSRCPDLF